MYRGEYFTNGILSEIILEDGQPGIRSNITGKKYKITELQKATREAAQLGVAEAHILTGSSLDPYSLGHVSQVEKLNEILSRAETEPMVQRFLEERGLGHLSGKSIQIQRLGYSDPQGITAGSGKNRVKGLPVAFQDLHAQEDPTVIVGGRRVKFSTLTAAEKESLDFSTIGFASYRQGTATVLRYQVHGDDDGLFYLTARQIEELRVGLNSGGYIDPKKLIKSIGKNLIDEETGGISLRYSPESEVGGLFQKINKRYQLSEREFQASPEEIQNLVADVVSEMQTGPYAHLLKNEDMVPKSLKDISLYFNDTEARLLESITMEDGQSLLKHLGREIIAADPSKERERRAIETVVTRNGQEAEQFNQKTFQTLFQFNNLSEQDYHEFNSLVKGYYASLEDKTEFSLNGLFEYVSTAESNLSNEQKNIIQHAIENYKRVGDGSQVTDEYLFRNLGRQKLKDAANKKEYVRNAAESVLEEDLSGVNDIFEHLNNVADTSTLSLINQQLARDMGVADATVDSVRQNVMDIEKSVSRVLDKNLEALPLQDITATRFGLGEGTAKSVADVGTALLDLGYLTVGSEELVKKETSFGSFGLPGEQRSGEYIVMDPGGGHGGTERVASELQANIFHSDVYNSPELIQQVRENFNASAQQIQHMMDTGEIPEEILAQLERTANIDVSRWDELFFHDSFAAQRSKAQAQEIVAHLRSGGKVNDIPGQLNKIVQLHAREAMKSARKTYRNAKGEIVEIQNPNLATTQRSAVDAEGTMALRKPTRIEPNAAELNPVPRLVDKNAYKDVAVNIGENETTTARLLKYRHDGHKFVVPDIAASQWLYAAGGGFDMDDKFITDLHYINAKSLDEGGNLVSKRQLVSFDFRQPTGPQEFAIMTPQLDDLTLQRMFGSKDKLGMGFRDALDDFAEEISSRHNIAYTTKTKGTMREILAASKATEEERAILYLQAIAADNMELAAIYRGANTEGYLADEIINDAIFSLMDREAQRSAGGYGAARFRVHSINDTLLDRLTTINEQGNMVIKGSTILQLTPEEIAMNPALVESYRKDLRIQIQEVGLSISEDTVFNKNIKDLINANTSEFGGKTYEEMLAAARQLTPELTENQFIYATAHQILKEDHTLAEKVLTEFGLMKQRIEIKTTTAQGGKVGSYIDALGFVDSQVNQMRDIINKLEASGEAGSQLAEMLKQPFLVYNPETALDFSIGGAGKMFLASQNIAEDLQDILRTFNPGEFTDPEEAVYKMLYGLTEQYRDDLLDKSVTNQYQGLQNFIQALKSTDEATAQAAKDLINIELRNVEEAMISSSGIAFGKARALYYHGLLDESEGEALLIGLDEIATRIKGSNTENFSLFLTSIIEGANEAKYRINELGLETEGTETTDRFTAFIQSILDESKPKPRPGRDTVTAAEKQRAQEISFNRALSDAEFGLVHGEEAKSLYGVSGLIEEAERFNDFITKTITGNKPTSALYNRLKRQSEYAAYDINVTELMPQIERQLRNLNVNGTEYDLMAANIRMNKALNDLAQMKAKGYIDPRKVSEILEKANIGVSTNELNSIHSRSQKLAFAEDLIARRREELQTAARESVYNSLTDFITKLDNPGDITSAMESYFLRVIELQTSQNRDEQKFGSILDSLLTYGQEFFGQADRLALDEMYIHARNQLTFNATAGVAEQEQRVSNFLSMLGDGEGETLADKLRSIFQLHGEANLLEKDPYKRKYIGDVYDDEFNLYRQEVLPEIKIRGTDLNIADVLGEEYERMFEDFVQLHISGDQQNTAKLIMQKRFANVENDAEVAEQAKAYIDELKMIGMRYEAKSAEISPKVLELLEQFSPGVNTEMPMTTRQILDVFNENVGELAEDELAAIRAALGDETGAATGTIGGPGREIPFKSIGEMIGENFPRIGRIGNRIGEHKFAVAGTLAAAGAGAAIYHTMRSKDHTPESIGGPPLLPGGNPYDRRDNITVQYPDFASLQNQDDAESYDVLVSGTNAQMQKFINQASIITDSNSNSTIYSGISDPSNDPFEDVASSY